MGDARSRLKQKIHREKTVFVQEGAGLKNQYATQFSLLPVAPCCSLLLPVTISSPLLLYLFYLCILNKKKKNLYKYI
jgi:hypothetical protein